MNIILRGTIRYLIKCDKYPDDNYGHFQSVIKRMLKTIPDVEELFLMVSFLNINTKGYLLYFVNFLDDDDLDL